MDFCPVKQTYLQPLLDFRTGLNSPMTCGINIEGYKIMQAVLLVLATAT
jgi:hypothetical protein